MKTLTRLAFAVAVAVFGMVFAQSSPVAAGAEPSSNSAFVTNPAFGFGNPVVSPFFLPPRPLFLPPRAVFVRPFNPFFGFFDPFNRFAFDDDDFFFGDRPFLGPRFFEEEDD